MIGVDNKIMITDDNIAFNIPANLDICRYRNMVSLLSLHKLNGKTYEYLERYLSTSGLIHYRYLNRGCQQ